MSRVWRNKVVKSSNFVEYFIKLNNNMGVRKSNEDNLALKSLRVLNETNKYLSIFGAVKRSSERYNFDFKNNFLVWEESVEGLEVFKIHRIELAKVLSGMYESDIKLAVHNRFSFLLGVATQKVDVAWLKNCLQIIMNCAESKFASTDLVDLYLLKRNYLREKNSQVYTLNIINNEIQRKKEELKEKEELIEIYKGLLYNETELNYSERVYYEVEELFKIINKKDLDSEDFWLLPRFFSLKVAYTLSYNYVGYFSSYSKIITVLNAIITTSVQGSYLKTCYKGMDEVYDLSDIRVSKCSNFPTVICVFILLRWFIERDWYNISGLNVKKCSIIERCTNFISDISKRHDYRLFLYYSASDNLMSGNLPIYLTRSTTKYDDALIGLHNNVRMDENMEDEDLDESDFACDPVSEDELLFNNVIPLTIKPFECISKVGNYYQQADFVMLQNQWSETNLEEKTFLEFKKGLKYQYFIRSEVFVLKTSGWFSKQREVLERFFIRCFCYLSGYLVLTLVLDKREFNVKDFINAQLSHWLNNRVNVVKKVSLLQDYSRYIWYEFNALEYTEILNKSVDESLLYLRQTSRDAEDEVLFDDKSYNIETEWEFGGAETVDEEEEWFDFEGLGEFDESLDFNNIDWLSLAEFCDLEGMFEVEYRLDQLFLIPTGN